MADFLDLSKTERITPRVNSWDKVCARLDQAEKTRTLRFRIFSALPIAASFLLVGFSLFLSSVDSQEITPITTSQVATADDSASSEVTVASDSTSDLGSWYSDLGQSDDDLETLDESQALSYLLKKEDK
jgi:hypothetical protein